MTWCSFPPLLQLIIYGRAGVPPRVEQEGQRRVPCRRHRLVWIVGLERQKTCAFDGGERHSLQHGQLRGHAAHTAVEEQPDIDGLAIRIDTEPIRGAVGAGAATARTALHDLTILGSHGGALSLVGVPE